MKSKRIVTLIISFIALLGLAYFVLPDVSFAQQSDLGAVGETAGLANTDPRLIVARIIRAGLGLMGIIAVCIVIYAGFLWMTAGGDSSRIEKAKRLLINAAIGLVIIFASVAIVQFVISAIVRATGLGTSGQSEGADCLDCFGGGGDIGFAIEEFRPEGEIPIRNVVARAYFSKLVNEDTLSGAVQVLNVDTTNEIPVTFAVVGDTLKITPQEACPAPNEDRFCFPENTKISVQFLDGIKSVGGQDLICSGGTYECSFTFKTGSLVDTAPPEVNITTPFSGERFNKELPVPVQAHVTDDAMVSGSEFYADEDLFGTEPAAGQDLRDVLIDTAWDARLYPDNKTYRIMAVGYDMADNSARASISIRLNPSYCYDQDIDADQGETALGCGGACGVCDAQSCAEDGDCASGHCLENRCVAVPQIAGFEPSNGAPGTYVTLMGTGFGSVPGTVYFTGAEGLIKASIPACSDGWSDTVMIVEVPEGAVDGPIVIRNADGMQDATNDEYGEVITDFDANEVRHPGLCRVSPNSGQPRSTATVYGNSFGANQDSGFILFDKDDLYTFGAVRPQGYGTWTENAVPIVVPALEQDDYLVTLTQAGETSNPAPYYVRFSTEAGIDTAPRIQSLAPEEGAIGSYVTITGVNFGSRIDKVWFENTEDRSLRALGSIDFPEACTTDDIWQESQIIIKVPAKYPDGSAVEPGSFDVFVQVGAETTDAVNFGIVEGLPGPQVCAIDPRQGEAGTKATLYGENFGAQQGTVIFSRDAAATVVRWTSGAVDVTVPDGETGLVVLRDASGPRPAPEQGVNFTYGSAEPTQTETSQLGGYGWKFSTGDIRNVPGIVVACTDDVKSAVPNSLFNETVCRNVIGSVQFTTGINPGSLRSGETVNVYKCLNDSCDRREGPFEQVVLAKIGATETGITEVRVRPPNGLADANTHYRVEIVGGPNGIVSMDGEPMPETVGWEFVTGPEDDLCTVDEVLVQPSVAVLHAKGAEQTFTAGGYTESCILLGDDFDWAWSAQPSIASLSEGACQLPNGFDQDSCVMARAVGDGHTQVRAQEPKSRKQDEAELTVDFTDPFVVDTWPNCQDACTNAEVGGSFNVPVAMTGQGSILQPNAVDVYECENELCASVLNRAGMVAECTEVVMVGGEQGCLKFKISNPTLSPDKFYRARVSGQVRSLSGKPLTKLTTSTHYVWRFSTSNEACAIDSLLMNPMSPVATHVGDRQSFTAVPLSEPDHCSVAGQRLDASAYNWSWQNPIINKANVAKWVTAGGTLLDAGTGTITGCTSNCLPSGSEPVRMLCGNGRLEIGEECEDGNAQGDDGCSATCLREAKTTTCGDGVVQKTVFSSETYVGVYQAGAEQRYLDLDNNPETHGFIGEECDDGNRNNGDGCSASCQNEGSRYSGTTCGNSDVAFNPNHGGEDCDDGNSRDGDGCSSVCLAEGSVSLANQRAVCGDGVIQEPYESCDDDGTSSGDGCSATCVREGVRGGTTWQPLCGNGAVDRAENGSGEDCDGGDGCGPDCLWRGSSLAYDEPSVCGDGETGLGEYDACEDAAVSTNVTDARIDPTQVAEIAGTAPAQITAGGNSVGATIRVEPVGYNVGIDTSYTLSCGARDDSDCVDSNTADQETYGVGIGGCCVARPRVVAHSPQGSNVCRNVLPSFVVTTEVNTESARENIRIVKVDGGACPADHTVAISPKDRLHNPVLAFGRRIWRNMIPVIHAQGDCLVPVQGVTEQGAGDEFKVDVATSILLAPNSTYEFRILGDDSMPGDAPHGLQSTLGSRMIGDYAGADKRFTTGEEICDIDLVKVDDPSGDPPGYFAIAGESGARTFTATAYNVQNGVEQEIQETPEYGWTWNGWRSDDTAVATIGSTESSGSVARATIIPQRDNGQAAIVATLSVDGKSAGSFCEGGTNNGHTCGAAGDCPGEGASCVQRPLLITGAQEVETFFCERPWPANFPLEDVEGNDDGISPGIQTGEWTDFSTYYCRDAGEDGLAEDLPSLRAVQPPQLTPIAGLQKEFFFEVDDAELRGDVIGIRVISNPTYLSPEEWYSSQQFEGSPANIEVDGFSAVRDGRTVYIAGARQTKVNGYEQLRSNIYILSYNEGASSITQGIFDQMLGHFELLANIENGPGLCAGDQSKGCVSDIDCGQGDVCQDVKGKVARDIERLTELNRMARGVEQYAVKNGTCSATNKACTVNADCPSGEVCRPLVPDLATGTFVPGFSASTWPSWDSELATKIVGTQKDPINKYPVTADGQSICSGDSQTCYNESSRTYLCAEDALVYHFTRDVSDIPAGKTYQLQGQLEYAGAVWEHPIPTYPLGVLRLSTNADGNLASGFTTDALACNGISRGSSSVCGDGIVGRNEVCELGGPTSTQTCALTGGGSGRIATRCTQTCTGYEVVPGAACVAARCGNGVIDAGEQCDDGAENGKYGFCSTSCSYADAPRCGDSQVDPGEACDCGVANDGIADGRTVDGSVCAAGMFNGKYAPTSGSSCSWDCRGPAAYCGDRIQNGVEACDGTAESTTKACANGAACTTNADCGTNNGICGDAKVCSDARVCQAGDVNRIGTVCGQDSDCDTIVGGQSQADGQCSPLPVERGVTRTCGAPGSTGVPAACQYAATWGPCLPVTTCGNGAVELGEECDDGNRENGDACSNVCRFNVCGDGFVFQGVEACDNGERNGQACDAAYDASCSYCASNCSLSVRSGSYCGDGIRQPATELCDAGDVPYNWITPDGEDQGICERSQLGQTRSFLGAGIAICAPAGLCSGGDRNGSTCLTQGATGAYAGLTCEAGGGSCALPSCKQDCQTACPFNYDADILKFASQFEGASRDASILLTKTDEFDPTDTVNDTRPAARATLFVPACRVAGPIMGDVEFNLDRPNKAYVMIVNDLSGSMRFDAAGGSVGLGEKSRMQILKDALTKSDTGAIDTLFRELGTNVKIGVAAFGRDAGVPTNVYGGMTTLNGSEGQSTAIDGYAAGTTYAQTMKQADTLRYGQVSSFLGFNEASTLKALVNGFTADGNTQTAAGMIHALWAFDRYVPAQEEARRIIILMTDGDFTANYAPSYQACVAKSKGYEVYTIRLGMDGEANGLFNPITDATTLQPVDCGDMGAAGSVPRYTDWIADIQSNPPRLCSALLDEENGGAWDDQTKINHFACLSTGNPDNINGLDYAYTGDSEEEFADAFKQIVATIVGATIEYTVPLPGGGFKTVPGEIVEGSGVQIPYPEGFTCDSGREQLIPITMRFYGSGSVRLSNFRFNYCKP